MNVKPNAVVFVCLLIHYLLSSFSITFNPQNAERSLIFTQLGQFYQFIDIFQRSNSYQKYKKIMSKQQVIMLLLRCNSIAWKLTLPNPEPLIEYKSKNPY